MNPQRFSQWQGWGITILRVVVGIVFVMHGGQKLFSYGFSGVAQALGQAGIPAPMLSGVMVTAVEFLGGLALLLGLFTCWAAILLAINMLGAIVTVHWQAGFFLPMGFEFALTLLAANVTLALAGPGAASLDMALAKRGVWPYSQ
ncbi:MAG: DoxX family protein [Nitrospinae bacterium]|nr:DoxX family protein [Nitrospinota bacterium]